VRVGNLVQPGPGRGIGEDARGEARPVNPPVGGQGLGAECLEDFLIGFGSRLDNIAGDRIGADHYGAQFPEECGDRALPAGQPPRQSDDPGHQEGSASMSRQLGPALASVRSGTFSG